MYDKRSSKQSRHIYIYIYIYAQIFSIHNHVFNNHHILLHNGNIMQVYRVYVVVTIISLTARMCMRRRACPLYNSRVGFSYPALGHTKRKCISRKISVGIKSRFTPGRRMQTERTTNSEDLNFFGTSFDVSSYFNQSETNVNKLFRLHFV